VAGAFLEGRMGMVEFEHRRRSRGRVHTTVNVDKIPCIKTFDRTQPEGKGGRNFQKYVMGNKEIYKEYKDSLVKFLIKTI